MISSINLCIFVVYLQLIIFSFLLGTWCDLKKTRVNFLYFSTSLLSKDYSTSEHFFGFLWWLNWWYKVSANELLAPCDFCTVWFSLFWSLSAQSPEIHNMPLAIVPSLHSEPRRSVGPRVLLMVMTCQCSLASQHTVSTCDETQIKNPNGR